MDAPPPARTIALPGGRVLAWACHGAPAGRPLYAFHGFPGCRLQAALLHEQALAAGVCLLAPAPPGFGASSPAPRPTPLHWPPAVAALAAPLGHRRFGVLGISCGGAYALACASAMPARIAYAGLLAGIGPMDLPAIRAGQLPALKVLFGLARAHPLLASPMLLADAWLFRRNPAKALDTLASLLAEPDRRLLEADAPVRERFAASFVEAYRQGIASRTSRSRSTCTKAASTATFPRPWAGTSRRRCPRGGCASTPTKATFPSW